MPLTDEQKQRIQRALETRAGHNSRCPWCLNNGWALADDPVYFHLQPDPKTVGFGGPALPLIVVTCRTCGFTATFNLLLLGLGDELGITRKEDRPNG